MITQPSFSLTPLVQHERNISEISFKSPKRPSPMYRLLSWLFVLSLGGGLVGVLASCGDSPVVSCKTNDDCLAGQVCYQKGCRNACKTNDDCLGLDQCNATTGLCGASSSSGTEQQAESSPTDGGVFDQPTQNNPQCGNQRAEQGEVCDGTDLAGQSCQSQGFAGGTLRCDGNCRFDTSLCQKTTDCGNGVIDLGEDCDGSNLNGQSCQSRGFSGGTLQCTPGCRFDTSPCSQASSCGNGNIDSNEDCDGANLNNQTCQSKGFAGGGTLRCTNQCRFDTSQCQQTSACGNGNIDSGEDCDGTNLNNQTCQAKGFASGSLKCTSGCKLDTSGCVAAPNCGNGNIDGGEDCDGTNLNNQTCQAKGFASGSLKCTAGCQFDTSGCVAASACGNGNIDSGEDCDGTNLNNQTCQTRGFSGGALQCSTGCKWDTSGCTQATSKKKFGESCGASADCDSNLCLVRSGDTVGYCSAYCDANKPCPTSPAGATCLLQISSGMVCGWSCTPGGTACPTGLSCVTLSNSSVCLGGTPTTPAQCGNNKVESGEECDGTDLASQTCQTRGFTGGTLKCTSCRFDTSGCTGTSGPALFGKPCPSSNDCGTGLTCVNFGSNQLYCTASCSSSKPCPSSPPGAACNIQLQGGGSVCGWTTTTGAPPICGNSVIDPGEDCDKTAMGSTCKGLGFSGGTLSCSATCTYDTSGCTGTTTCPNLPARHCTGACSTIVRFSPDNGPGYRVRHGDRYSWARQATVTYVKYAAASVNCVYPGTAWLGLGDMSMQNGATPADTAGNMRHPQGTHTQGRDMDIGYFQINQADNDLRPVCVHVQNGQDQYHCVQTPNILDATKTAFFISKLLESNSVRVIGVDGKIGPMLKTAMQTLHTNGIISKTVFDIFDKGGAVTWEETDQQRGWYLFHHHHLHVSFR